MEEQASLTGFAETQVIELSCLFLSAPFLLAAVTGGSTEAPVSTRRGSCEHVYGTNIMKLDVND